MAVVTKAGAPVVRAWEESVTIPTYPVPPPDRNPMFLDKRVYQGSSGKVYPNPFTDRLSDQKNDQRYQAVFIENEYIRLMILPEIGGRIHIGLDKTNNYDFFYRQDVIKPALVGLLGPWISGGVEFNWPQHHRPSTYMPVQHVIEEHADGSRTVWLSEHEPMNRMKGMVGVCLHPGKAIVEAKVRLYNRTPFVQTFLWWANVGIRVHDQYQAFFPPDVTFVADHARRAMSRFPMARDFYYGVDYRAGVDITWYRNIPVPTSYMVTKSEFDFFGGYDHAARAGVVHVANHHIAPGKKLWTWGNADFGYAWDRELTDSGGPYIELMAGVFTDNQPDFSWLQPFETRTFTQFWYPIQEIGPAKNANQQVAVNLEPASGGYRIGVCATELLRGVTVSLSMQGNTVFERSVHVEPGKPFIAVVPMARARSESDLLLRVRDSQGRELIRYRPIERGDPEPPAPASEPRDPDKIDTTEELYLTGLHLEQYRHATRYAETYWTEALNRDPEDVRSNNAMGLLLLRRGQFHKAEAHFRRALSRLTRRNSNPYDGEPWYNLGVTLQYQGRLADARAAFYKAAWNYAWQSASYHALAAIDCLEGNPVSSLEHLDRALSTNTDSLKTRDLKTAVLRVLGRTEEAAASARQTVEIDPLDLQARYELAVLAPDTEGEFFGILNGALQSCLDVAFDYAAAGLWADAENLMERFLEQSGAAHPMLRYATAWMAESRGDGEKAARWYRAGREAPSDYCFPSRLEEMIVLEAALRHDAGDARAHYYLGNLLYDKNRREEAIGHWEQAGRLDAEFSIPWRNLGIACYNVRRQPGRAIECYEKACRSNPSDARLLYEFDQLRKRTAAEPRMRLAELERRRDLVDQRDDLTIELVSLYNFTGQSDTALAILLARRFHPWEGGEGLVSGQYVAAHMLLGVEALGGGNAGDALSHFEAARHYPHNLGEGKHLLTRETHLDYFGGLALTLASRAEEAKGLWRRAADTENETDMFAYYRALALRCLGDDAGAIALLRRLHQYAEAQINADVKIDYFATSLPNFLLFEDDLGKRNRIECLFLRGLANLGLNRLREAAADLTQVLAVDRSHLFARLELDGVVRSVEETTPTP
jgi:tetratricopeptide (TPR) repeat protein